MRKNKLRCKCSSDYFNLSNYVFFSPFIYFMSYQLKYKLNPTFYYYKWIFTK